MSESIKFRINGVDKTLSEPLKVTQVCEELFPDQIKPGPESIVVCKINGELRDLWSDIKNGDEIETISISSPEGLSVLRHSTAHVLAQAVQGVFAQTRLGIGPPITDGFYYDFDPPKPFYS